MIRNTLKTISPKKLFIKDRLGYFFFLTGIFLLPSALAISVLFFLVSIFIAFLNPLNLFKDKWNYPIFITSIFLILSTLKHFDNTDEIYKSFWDPSLSLLGLLNWIPLFLCFFGFQKYLDSPSKRITSAKLFICGSIPILISGLLQLLNINGPFEILNGLIIWYQKPISGSVGGIGALSGLFNNQNYAGLWMAMVWPFCLAAYNQKNLKPVNKIILLLICISFFIFIVLTESRNAFLGLLISTPLVLGTSCFLWYLPTVVISFSLLLITVIPIFPDELQIFIKSIIPARLYTKFPEIGFNNLIEYPRINKWSAALGFIIKKPIFGWGAASFPVIYKLEKGGEWFGHAHNLPLDLAVSYGLIPSLLIFSVYLLLLFKTFKKFFTKKYKDSNTLIKFQKAWWASSFVFFISHLSDVQYFDGRISLICWILLAGLRSSLKEKDAN